MAALQKAYSEEMASVPPSSHPIHTWFTPCSHLPPQVTPHLEPPVATLQKAYGEEVAKALAAAKKIGVVILGDGAAAAEEAKDAREEEGADQALALARSQPLGLLCALLAAKDWKNAHRFAA